MSQHNKNPILKNLQEQFQNLLPDESAPEELKEEVFNTIDKIEYIESGTNPIDDNPDNEESPLAYPPKKSNEEKDKISII